MRLLLFERDYRIKRVRRIPVETWAARNDPFGLWRPLVNLRHRGTRADLSFPCRGGRRVIDDQRSKILVLINFNGIPRSRPASIVSHIPAGVNPTVNTLIDRTRPAPVSAGFIVRGPIDPFDASTLVNDADASDE